MHDPGLIVSVVTLSDPERAVLVDRELTGLSHRPTGDGSQRIGVEDLNLAIVIIADVEPVVIGCQPPHVRRAARQGLNDQHAIVVAVSPGERGAPAGLVVTAYAVPCGALRRVTRLGTYL